MFLPPKKQRAYWSLDYMSIAWHTHIYKPCPLIAGFISLCGYKGHVGMKIFLAFLG